MGSPTFNMVDDAKTIAITASEPLDMCVSAMNDLIQTLWAFTSLAPLASVSSTAATGVSTFTLKDGRTVTYTLSMGATPPASITFNVVSSSYWSAAEFYQIQALAQIIVTLTLQYGMETLSVTYV